MEDKNKRRQFLKKLSLVSASLAYSFSEIADLYAAPKKTNFVKDTKGVSFKDNFSEQNDRVWIGEDYWAIPMEDWRIKNGRAEFTGIEKSSTLNVLTVTINEGLGDFTASTRLGLLRKGSNGKGGKAGFSIGIKDDLDSDVRAACYYGKGINAGVSTTGHLFIADQTKSLPKGFDYSDFSLEVKASSSNNKSGLILFCTDKKNNVAEVTYDVQKDISGLIALSNNYEITDEDTFWFSDLKISGSKIKSQGNNSFGPILWAMYTLSKGTLKISAQMPPVGEKDNRLVDLYFKENNAWKHSSSQRINEDALTSVFTIERWDTKKDIPYQLTYKNNGKEYKYEGLIRQEPLGRPLVFGGLTCQHGSGYPYGPVVKNLEKHNPDMLYFSGDQIYEPNGNYPIKRQPEADAILNYLGKWYMFGWAFGNIMRSRPTICTPDDHDVFQGNLWGEEGERVSFEKWETVRGTHGGYVQTPKWLNVVAQTQCGHMPPCFDDEPIQEGIKAWYTSLVYANISFAVISDRMFKSGPELIHLTDRTTVPLTPAQRNAPLEFLGNRQILFLEHWINDWQGANMKVLLSQTIFASVATHHGNDKEHFGDLDSGGWPKKQRDQALRVVRKACAFHINGDQHLPFIVQYSLDTPRDAGWTFCTPAISTGFPRWCEPDIIPIPHIDRPAHNLPNTGLYPDMFGNMNYIYAVGNPQDNFLSEKNRYKRAQMKSSGFGIITFNTNDRTIKMEAYHFFADKDHPKENDQFPGWPLTINQLDNDGRKPVAYLPTLRINKPDQVVKLINETDQETVSIFRIKGTDYKPGVFKEGTYTIQVGEGKSIKEFKGLKSEGRSSEAVIKVTV